MDFVCRLISYVLVGNTAAINEERLHYFRFLPQTGIVNLNRLKWFFVAPPLSSTENIWVLPFVTNPSDLVQEATRQRIYQYALKNSNRFWLNASQVGVLLAQNSNSQEAIAAFFDHHEGNEIL
ncbi:hypothetical protein HUJ04_009949 [Dendroctonus ponderosae]|nr:hypothetical protein HUJ04_009949 [Dendroctonus ponderosae]